MKPHQSTILSIQWSPKSDFSYVNSQDLPNSPDFSYYPSLSLTTHLLML